MSKLKVELIVSNKVLDLFRGFRCRLVWYACNRVSEENNISVFSVEFIYRNIPCLKTLKVYQNTNLHPREEFMVLSSELFPVNIE